MTNRLNYGAELYPLPYNFNNKRDYRTNIHAPYDFSPEKMESDINKNVNIYYNIGDKIKAFSGKESRASGL
jgi:hypothetical protein